MSSTAILLATSPAECPPMPSATIMSAPLVFSRVSSSGRMKRPESSLISRTQPTSVWTLATISCGGVGRRSSVLPPDLFLPNIHCPLLFGIFAGMRPRAAARSLLHLVHILFLLADDEVHQ